MDYLALMRPLQWVKNGFVLVGLFFSRRWGEPELVIDALTAFVAFCLVSSAVYAMNDVIDRERDRKHPKKQHRPVASGAVSPRGAILFAVLLALAGVSLGARLSMTAAALLACYLLLNIVYSGGGKHVPVLDVFMIAGGFMLRLLAGTAGIGVAPSQWLIICGLMVTLCLGFAKRRAELMGLADQSGAHRPVLEGYTPQLLDTMIAVTAAALLVTYGLYTVANDTVATHGTDQLIWTLPFVAFGIFRFLYLVHVRGAGPDPALEITRDPHLVIAFLGWFATTIAILV